MFLHVTAVRWIEDHVLALDFDDGSRRRVDLSAHLWGPAFEPLQDVAYFRRAALNPDSGTVEWPNGADFAPEFLHRIGEEEGEPA